MVAEPSPGWHRADTRWQQHTLGAPTGLERRRRLGRKRVEPVKASPRFNSRTKTEKVRLECEECEETVRRCHLSSLRRTQSHPGKKQRSERSRSSPRKEGRRRRGAKGGRSAPCFHHLHRCLEWKHPGTIRRDVPSGFHHGSQSSEPLRFCSTPCLNKAAGI